MSARSPFSLRNACAGGVSAMHDNYFIPMNAEQLGTVWRKKSKWLGGLCSARQHDSAAPPEIQWLTGRRFELARLLGDRIVRPTGGRLFPATRACTYRQKMQRSFAAELLSPFDVVDEMLAGDYSMESQSDVAEHFNASEWTIRTQLVNHRRLDREDLNGDIEAAA